MAVDLLLCVATDLEASLLRTRLEGLPAVTVLQTGVGPVNAAHAVTLFLAKTNARAIVICGVGGAYPDSGLAVGDVVCASSEQYGDLGASSPSGFLDMQALGFPVVDGPTPLYNELPMQVFPHERRVPFVTVSSCSGTDAVASDLAQRTKGAVENMEGAAVAHVAHLHGVPVGELRGISNLVTNRNTKAWRLKEAAEAAQEALVAWIVRH